MWEHGKKRNKSLWGAVQLEFFSIALRVWVPYGGTPGARWWDNDDIFGTACDCRLVIAEIVRDVQCHAALLRTAWLIIIQKHKIAKAGWPALDGASGRQKAARSQFANMVKT